MTHFKFITALFLVSFLIISCNSDQAYLIAENKVGEITNSTKINELEQLFPNDSIVKPNYKNRFEANGNDVYIYENGDLSLKIQPRIYGDSTSTIREIQILNPKYKTANGLNVNGDFKTIYENYSIKTIQNSFKNVIVDIKEFGLYVIIDKAELPSNLRYDRTSTITETQIPNQAKFKYVWFAFDAPQEVANDKE